ncbi:LysM peptidoglycan-binding domain-containing protein, partial [Streptomyces daliensis]|nr:LysM peptidoglycan-binding domain-containing protein [Streptomyces daliensis]
MRSGNGRHRRPRQAPALFVAAGVTGAGIALPLLGATGAHAADTATWDRVAECESGGLWSANKGNGYYGGLQLTMDTWEDYGGTDYAERPDLASRSQQISVAEKILDDQGPDAWPSCSVNGGLTEDSTEKPDVNPGDDDGSGDSGDATEPVPERPYDSPSDSEKKPDDSSDSSDSPDPEKSDGSGDASSSPSPSPSPSEDEGDDSASPEAPSETTPGNGTGTGTGAGTGTGTGTGAGGATEGTGKHRGTPDQREGDGEDDERASRGKHGRDGAEEADGDEGHRVRSGESLSAIASEHKVRGGWDALYDRNRDVVGSDPDLILPGQ